MEVLFLDIDGCLNHCRRGEDMYYDAHAGSRLPLDPDNMAALKSVFDRRPGLKVVWSTDWRHCDEPIWHGRWENPRLYLESLPWFAGRVIGNTPKKMSSEHFHEIKWWLDEHTEVENYAIVEDSYFPDDWFGLERHVVRCDHTKGLTSAGADDIIRILEGMS